VSTPADQLGAALPDEPVHHDRGPLLGGIRLSILPGERDFDAGTSIPLVMNFAKSSGMSPLLLGMI
jgi:hypothetical protein